MFINFKNLWEINGFRDDSLWNPKLKIQILFSSHHPNLKKKKKIEGVNFGQSNNRKFICHKNFFHYYLTQYYYFFLVWHIGNIDLILNSVKYLNILCSNWRRLNLSFQKLIYNLKKMSRSKSSCYCHFPILKVY